MYFAIMQGDGNFCVYRGSGPGDAHGYLWGILLKSLPIGQFFAVMQGDGNLCVYQGSSPGADQVYVWCALNKSQPSGQFFAIVQDDGNLCVYRGTGPTDNGGSVWTSGVTDPIVDAEISSIDYDLASAKTLYSAPAELYRQTVHNDTTQLQTSAISGSASVAETSGWSDSLAVKVGVSTSFKTGIPFVAEGKITVSVEVTNTYTWNGSTTATKTWGFNTPVNVPPHTTIVALVTTTLSTISVPYTLKGTFILKSGVRITGSIKGIYTGTNSHDLNVTFIQQNPVTSQIQSITQPIEAKPVQVIR